VSTNIKQAYATGGNATRVAFEEIGGLFAEAWIAVGSAFAVSAGLVAACAFFPLLLIPCVGLMLVVGAGAAGVLAGNKLSKLAGRYLYDNNVSSLSNSDNFDGLTAL